MTEEARIKPPPLRTLTKADIVFHILNYTILVAFTMTILYPMIFVFSASVSDVQAVLRREVWLWPVGFNLAAYRAAFEFPNLMRGFGNSLLYAAVAATFVPALTMITAYPLSRKSMPGRNLFLVYFTITMFFNGGMIPNYLLIRNLGLMNTVWSVTIAFAFSFFNVIVARTYITSSIPEELYEAAKMDGSGEWFYFLRIIIPLSKPVIAIFVLWTAIGNWSGFFNQLLFLSDISMHGIQMVLRDLLFVITMTEEQRALMDPLQLAHREETARALRFAVIYIGAAPMLILYPFVQKHFVKGVMIGAIKG